jgi:hypothetical protein
MQRPSPASTEYQHDKDGEGDNSDIASTELPALFKDCSTDEARTAWIVAKLKATSFSEVHELLDITEVRHLDSISKSFYIAITLLGNRAALHSPSNPR